jgi:integrase
MSRSTGIEVRHSRACPARADAPCRCKPTYQANVWSSREHKRIRRTFATEAAARAWRQDAQVALRRGTMRAPSATTLREAANAWLAGAKDGSVRTRSGDVYKPSALRGYEAALRDRILPALGAVKLSEIQRRDVQDLADRMLAQGLDPSTIRNALMPLRVIFRRAVARGEVAVNPTSAVELPAVRGRRDRVASPSEAVELLEALPERDRALWATALYAGLRRGELLAFRWEDVDLAAGVLRVERSWDVKVGAIETKTRAGRRSVPTAAALRDYLIEHKLRSGRSEGLVFGRSAERPFNHSSIVRRAATAWKRARAERAGGLELEAGDPRAGFEPIALHECRHTFASLMIAAGVNAKAPSTYMGHASVTITLDRYGHLMPGNEDAAAALLDAYLARADTRARVAAVEG